MTDEKDAPKPDDDIAPFEHIGDVVQRIVDRLRKEKDEAA